MGHNALGSITVNRIIEGKYPAPPELKEALKNPKVRQSFLGGSVGPDLFPDRTHRGSQSEFTQRMMDAAWREYRSAGNDPAAKEKAAQALGFAYGWMCHVATDLNVHPKVNELVGDAYDHNNAGEKVRHAAMEAQLYAYLKRVAGAKDPYDAQFPTDFVARQLGVSQGELKKAISRLRIIAAAEIASANQVKLTDSQLKSIWSESIRGSMQDTRDFVEKPSRFLNWDLDCGKISTADFEWLRNAVMAANGGKLPADWGKNYLKYWDQVKGLAPGDRMAKLQQLFGKKPAVTPPTSRNTGVSSYATLLSAPGTRIRVKVERDFNYPSRQGYGNIQLQWQGNHFSLTGNCDDYSMKKEFRIEGEMGEGEVAWVKVNVRTTMPGNPGFSADDVMEARHVPYVQGGLWDEQVGDVTFAAFTDKQAPGFSGSMKSTSGYSFVWDKSTMPGWSKGRTLYPIVTVRFHKPD